MIRNNFQFGRMDKYSHAIGGTYSEVVVDEIINHKIYEKFYSVSEGDLVIDVGANVGVFTESIMRRNPSHVYCLEPHLEYFEILSENMKIYPNVTCLNIAIGNVVGKVDCDDLMGSVFSAECTTWENFIDLHGIGHVNFLKMDAEGAEYDIIRPDNYLDVFNRVDYIVAEYHLENGRRGSTSKNIMNGNSNFSLFRDFLLGKMRKYKLYSLCGSDLRWMMSLPTTVFTDHFLNRFTEVILHIDTKNAF